MATTTKPAIDLTKSTATQTDAQIVLQLAALANTAEWSRGMTILFSTDEPLTYEEYQARYPRESEDRGAVGSVLRWYETMATLVKHGLLDRGITYDWQSVNGMWERCAPIALGQRAASGEPRLWENFEALAIAQRES